MVEAAQNHRKSSGAGFFCTADYRTATLGRTERHERWPSECETIVDLGELVGSVNGRWLDGGPIPLSNGRRVRRSDSGDWRPEARASGCA